MWYQGDNKVLNELKLLLIDSIKILDMDSIVQILKNKLKDGCN